MKNYVIINGVSSQTITGLMINELPPISKPPLRVQTEEIDGRDGDIITPLGYGAYNKTITIGLFGTGYDIDDIVSFFNGEGTIVFSNEPDKYYNYKIIEQIDYEALQKFKQASITFHCQPFKYPLSETPQEIEPNIKTLSNVESANITDSGISTLKLDLKGNTSQTGTPTPDSPIPVSVVSGDNEVVVCGKNLFDKDNIISGYRLDGSGNPSSSANNEFTSGFIPVESGTTYIRSYGNISAYTRTCFYDKNKSFVSKNDDSQSFTIPSNVKYIRFSEYLTRLDTMQLEKGSTATTYEPYQSQTYEVDLPVGLELCKIGTYQDYIYKDSGKWYKYAMIGKKVVDGSDSSYAGGTTGTNAYYLGANIPSVNENSQVLAYSNMFQPCSFNDRANGLDIIYSQNGMVNLRTANNTSIDWSDNTKRKNWLITNQPIVYYVLATPTDEEITDTNLIEQLDNLSNAMSYEGTTNVGQTNNDKAFLMDVDYLEQGTNEITINNIGNVYSKPTIALEGNGVGNIYLNDTQIFRVELTDKMTISTSMMEAYNPDTSALLNRQVVGNYNSMTLQPGNNTLRIDGIDKATITDYTRWL